MDRGSERATLIATLTAAPSASGEELARLPAGVEILEIRADLTGEIDPGWLRQACGKKLLYTLRSAAEGGACESSPGRRQQRLAAAAEAGYDLVDLEAERDLAGELLDRVPPEVRLISWHGGAVGLPALERRFEEMAATPARLYKLVPAAAQAGEDLAPLLLLHALRRRDVVAFATGAAGAWTRLVAPRLGAPVVFASAGDEPAAPGQPTVAALCRDYGLPELSAVESLYGIVGRPVAASLSPRLHNGLYRALGLPALYLPFHAEVFGDFWLEVVEGTALAAMVAPLDGLSVTAPFKEVALAVAGASSPLADAVGAANTLVRRGKVWEAETTDPEGVVGPLEERGLELVGAATVVVGAGGAGRAAAVALRGAGARVVLANRGRARGEAAARDLHLPFVALDELDVAAFGVVVHATPVGRRRGEEPPIAVSALRAGTVVIDLVYGTEPTELLERARARGLTAVDGREVLLHQAVSQVRLMTGCELPLELGRELLELAPPLRGRHPSSTAARIGRGR